MSFDIDWSKLTEPRLLAKVHAWIEHMLETKVNATLTDGTQIHLLELHPGSEPPLIELASMGMNRADTAAGGGTGESSSSVQQFAVPADQLLSESILGAGSSGPRTRTGSSGRGSPRGNGSGWDGTLIPGLIGSPSPSPSLLSSSLSSVSSSRVGGIASRCGVCGGRLAPPTTMPSFTLSGRVRYNSDFYVTLQVRRQVNPYVSTRGLHGRLARGHLPSGTMDWPMSVELWLRLGQLRIEVQLDATYTPPVKAAPKNAAPATGSSTHPPSALQSPSAHSRHSHPVHHHLSRVHSRSATPVHHHQPPHHAHNNQSAVSAARGGTLLVPPHFPSASASPTLPSHSYTPGISSSSSFSTPSLSPAFGAPAQCQCAAHAAAVSASSVAAPVAAAAPAAAAAASSPATVTILLDSNPLHGYHLSSVLDGSPAGAKLVRLADAAVHTALSALVGQQVTFELPDLSFADLKKKAAQANAKANTKANTAKAQANDDAASEAKSHD